MTHISDGLPEPQRRVALLAIFIGINLTVLDSTITNVALPTIARDFQVSASSSVWVVNGYQLALISCLLPSASLGGILGYRKVYLSGLMIFVLASIACVLARSLETLTIARFVQGLGAAGVMSVNQALIRESVPAARLGRAIGLNAMIIALASTTGPSLASLILTIAEWPWLFAINLPVGVLAIALGARALPVSQTLDHPFDFVSAGLNAVLFSALLIAASSVRLAGQYAVAAAAAAVASVAAFVLIRRQYRLKYPIVPIDLLADRKYRLSVVTSVCCFATQMAAYVTLPFYLQHDFGFSILTTGMVITGWPLGVALAAPQAGRLVDRISAGVLGTIGLCVLALGFLLLGTVPTGASPVQVFAYAMVCGVGFGLFQTPNNKMLMQSAPRHRSGAASGMLATARLLGQMTGAVLVAGMLGNLSGQVHGNWPLLAAAGIAILGASVSALRLR